MNKRILIVGAGNSQLPLIQFAKKEGHYVITSDYLPDNPGHALADECHTVSAMDKEGILALAKGLKLDGITSLSSDPIMPTIAYVAEQLGLPGPSIEAVAVLTQKDRFRQALRKAGLNTPVVHATDGGRITAPLCEASRYIVKPVDSCGSKGVTLTHGRPTQIEAALQSALTFSNSGRVIVEDYLDGPQVNGDGFLIDGHLVHLYMGDHVFFTKTNSFVPIITSWPSRHSDAVINDIKEQVERVTREAGYLYGPLNIEARITSDQKVYLIEVGPRSGGNYAPIILERLTGFNYLKGTLDLALGQLDPALVSPEKPYSLPGAYFVLHTEKTGVYAGLSLNPRIKKNLFFLKEFKVPGDMIERCTGSHTTFGVALLEFDSIRERDAIMNDIHSLIEVKLGISHADAA